MSTGSRFYSPFMAYISARAIGSLYRLLLFNLSDFLDRLTWVIYDRWAPRAHIVAAVAVFGEKACGTSGATDLAFPRFACIRRRHQDDCGEDDCNQASLEQTAMYLN